MLARIFRPAKTAMQSGRANVQHWVLEFEEGAPNLPDSLMGWTSSIEPNGQVRLYFDTREQAIGFAQARGIAFQVREPREPRRILKAYGDNFAFSRKEPWSH